MVGEFLVVESGCRSFDLFDGPFHLSSVLFVCCLTSYVECTAGWDVSYVFCSFMLFCQGGQGSAVVSSTEGQI